MLNPDTDIKEIMTIVVAGGLMIFRSNIYGASEAFKAASEFVAEAERRFGPLNPRKPLP